VKEVLGKTFASFVEQEEQSRISAALATMGETQKYEKLQFKMAHKWGEPVLVEARFEYSPLSNEITGSLTKLETPSLFGSVNNLQRLNDDLAKTTEKVSASEDGKCTWSHK
jgi:hypothetical protein